MATAEFIGALISLVSKSDIRYQGLLASINPEQATVALEKVRSWGTEGRLSSQGRPQEEIPASDHVYDYIMFRAADVKDLKIDDPTPPKMDQPASQPALNDPAILNSSAAPGRIHGGPSPMYGMPPPPPPFGGGGPFPGAAPGFAHPPPPQFNGMPSPSPQQQHLQQQQLQQRPTTAATPRSPAPTKAPEKSSTDKVLEEMSKLNVSKSSASASPRPPTSAQLPAIPHAATAAATATNSHDRRNNARENHHAQQQQQQQQPPANRGPRRAPGTAPEVANGGPSMPSKEFDFESANAKFQKHKEEAAEAPSGDASAGALLESIPPPSTSTDESFYDKSGFFDNISSEVRERYERKDPTRSSAQPRQYQDQGEMYTDHAAGEGGRGGSGRGGRGRGRGRANRMAEEAKNMQTFGDSGSGSGNIPGSGGRGRGRGGRGRGRGRGAPRAPRGNNSDSYTPM